MEGNVHWTGLFMIDKYGVLVLHESLLYFKLLLWYKYGKVFTLMFAMHDDKIDLVIFVMG